MGEELAELQTELKQLEDEFRNLEAEATALEGHHQGGTDHGGTLAALQQRCAELEQEQDELSVAKETAAAKQLAAEQSRRETLTALHEETVKLEKLAAEQAQKQRISIQNSAQELAAIAEKRERELQDLYRRLSKKKEEDDAVKRNLQSLMEKARTEVPVIEEEKMRMYDEIQTSWDIERDSLIKVYQNQKVIQRELFWHLKRGSYIKQRFKDPRNPGDTFDKNVSESKDSRISSEENKLVKDHNALKEQIANQKDELKQLKRAHDDMEKRWKAGPAIDKETGRIAVGRDGTPKLPEGSEAWYQQRVQRLKATLSREERTTKELVNESAELKTVRNGMAEQKRDQCRRKDALLRQNATVVASQQKERDMAALEEAQQRALHPQRIARDPVSQPHQQTKGRSHIPKIRDSVPAAGMPYHA